MLGKLAALVPRPAVNVRLYHGVLAPRARWPLPVVRYGRPEPDLKAQDVDARPRDAGTPRAWTWTALMRRVLGLDVLACPRCGGRLRVIAIVQAPLAGQALLTRLAPLRRPCAARPCPTRASHHHVARRSPSPLSPRCPTRRPLSAPHRPLLALGPLLDDAPVATQDNSGPTAIALATLAVAPHEAGRPRLPCAGFAMETGPGRR